MPENKNLFFGIKYAQFPLDKKAMETFILMQLDFCFVFVFFFKNIYPEVFSFPVVGIT